MAQNGPCPKKMRNRNFDSMKPIFRVKGSPRGPPSPHKKILSKKFFVEISTQNPYPPHRWKWPKSRFLRFWPIFKENAEASRNVIFANPFRSRGALTNIFEKFESVEISAPLEISEGLNTQIRVSKYGPKFQNLGSEISTGPNFSKHINLRQFR